MMNSAILVFTGAGLGGLARHGVNIAALRVVGSGFPAGTMAINVAGSLAMGVLAAWFAARVSDDARLFAMTGVLGGFTTFSAFSLDAVQLWQRGETGAFAVYVIGSVALSIGALIAGLAIGKAIA